MVAEGVDFESDAAAETPPPMRVQGGGGDAAAAAVAAAVAPAGVVRMDAGAAGRVSVQRATWMELMGMSWQHAGK